MAMQDNTVLPATAGAGGMNPQIAAFLQMLMGGGGNSSSLHQAFLQRLMGTFGGGGAEQGGLPFGGPGQGFGHFLMNNPGLMQSLFGLPPQGAVPGPLPGSAPVQDSTPVGAPGAAAASSPPNIPGTSTPLLSTSETPGLLKSSQEHPAADLAAGGAFSTPGALPNVLPSGFIRPDISAPGAASGGPGQFMQSILPPMLRRG